MYMNATSVSSKFSTKMTSAMMESESTSCLQFFYYMDMVGWANVLRVYISKGGDTYKGFEAVGIHRSWTLGQATVQGSGIFTVSYSIYSLKLCGIFTVSYSVYSLKLCGIFTVSYSIYSLKLV